MKIAIIGSGISGLASAALLARDGHAVSVFERFDTPRPLGAGLLLQPSGLEALDAMDLRQEAEARGAHISRLIGRTPKGRTVLDLRYADGRPGDKGVGIHRASLFNLLHAAALKTDIAWRTGLGVRALHDLDDRPRLELETGEMSEPYDLVIAADGTHSSLRRQICPQARDPVYPWGAMWAILPDPDERRDGMLDQVYRGCSVMIGLLPVGDNPADPEGRPGVSFFWSLRGDAFPAWRSDGLEAFKARLRALWPRAADVIDPISDADTFSEARYRDCVCPSWRRGKAVLIGDAAHGMSPQLGQGANLALCDALSLARQLKDDAPVVHALGRFEAERKPAARYYSLMSRALTPVFQSGSRIIGVLRDALMGLGCRLPGIRNWMGWTLVGRGRLPW
ncbi:NAD(P)/FAD-dependent oxidoreductase [Oceanicaulis sp. MMSF_3324]|uniref:FAD-dependent oxidoreductase n=1 Tax=Oceanicaulis sp. MMSF_3324 TaxID=3046702 RepID=UPI00273F55BC|nr:NAD(P)/FAD-dependent oxidoreductase [Oceanicaulis sp. MMSF_3324]